MSPDQEVEVKRMIEHSTSAEEGYGYESSWDTCILKHALEENYSISMTQVGIGKMLKRLGFSRTLPAYILKRADRKKQEAFQKELVMILDNS
ncbi:helix-turn-helix domain-containing protein [Pseudobacillus wudalianchiensis]|uniref:helix-turn-helix domain-containing protein n=1 Tax=Pseudobacillus wudalianchiensis TaxID=1743143 RepID=UPI001FDFB953|nr:winged helix-turn-helix domain-containing protein [Bacillus wudalianchiensis]